MKKIIFFDGDGTIWYPKKTKYSKHPVWIYREKDIKNPNEHLVLTPTAIETLSKLKSKGFILIMLSTSPNPERKAQKVLKEHIRHFKLEDYFDEVHATKPYENAKGETIIKIISKRKIAKSQALMVGDSYVWDYKSAKDFGIDAILIKSEYEEKIHKLKRTINKLSEVFSYLK